MAELHDSEIELMDPRDELSIGQIQKDEDKPPMSCGLIALTCSGRPSLRADSTLHWDMHEIIELQDKQPGHCEIKRMLSEGCTNDEIEGRLKKLKCRTILPLHELVCVDGILYRRSQNAYGELQYAVVLPPSFIPRTLTASHYTATAGHGGVRVMLAGL